MCFTVLSLFPAILRSYFESSIMAKAVENGAVSYRLIDIRDFAHDKHRTCDDAPYGGGAGQLMMAVPLGEALESVKAYKKHVVYVTPSGKPFTQRKAKALSGKDEIVVVCGRYEGIDQRIIDKYVDDEISVGDYVMSSGEVAAMVVIDAVYRLIDGVISGASLEEESFCRSLLEYPQYTHPQVYEGMEVPSVLRSGNHEAIRVWRLRKSIEKTLANRPDLIAAARMGAGLSAEAERIVEEVTAQMLFKHVPKRRRRAFSGKVGE